MQQFARQPCGIAHPGCAVTLSHEGERLLATEVEVSALSATSTRFAQGKADDAEAYMGQATQRQR